MQARDLVNYARVAVDTSKKFLFYTGKSDGVCEGAVEDAKPASMFTLEWTGWK